MLAHTSIDAMQHMCGGKPKPCMLLVSKASNYEEPLPHAGKGSYLPSISHQVVCPSRDQSAVQVALACDIKEDIRLDLFKFQQNVWQAENYALLHLGSYELYNPCFVLPLFHDQRQNQNESRCFPRPSSSILVASTCCFRHTHPLSSLLIAASMNCELFCAVQLHTSILQFAHICDSSYHGTRHQQDRVNRPLVHWHADGQISAKTFSNFCRLERIEVLPSQEEWLFILSHRNSCNFDCFLE
jgi:hypothetical protein